MEDRPKCVVMALTLALTGVLIALVAVIHAIKITEEGLGTRMAFCLLSMVLFMGIAGSMSHNGQWTWRFVISMEILCTVVPVLAYSFGAMDFVFCVLLVTVSCAMTLLTTAGKAKRWIEIDRI